MFVQIVFAVQHRQCLITAQHRDELEKYITGIVQNHGQKLFAIYSMPDHVHLLMGLEPSKSVSAIVREIKSTSSKFINSNFWFKGKFNWQEGFGAFSYSKSQIDGVIKYILNQEEHHKKRTFREEYIDFLKKFDIKYDEKYIFDFIE